MQCCRKGSKAFLRITIGIQHLVLTVLQIRRYKFSNNYRKTRVANPNRKVLLNILCITWAYKLKYVSRINSKLRSRKIYFPFFFVFGNRTTGMDTVWGEELEPVA